MSEYEVSVLVATYNPNKEKLFLTLASIICQKNVKMQIVITDDGSQGDYFQEVERWFAENNINDYELYKNEKNCGTVRNIFNGLCKCKGKYVKPISPADMLANEDVLREWVDDIEKHNMEWSFSNAIYYKNENGNIVPLKSVAHPQRISKYNKNNSIKKNRKNYLIYNDICLGATTLCKRKTMEKYLNMIVGKVVYAEDNIYRIMMADNINAYFFNKNAIVYETGQGVSTSKSEVWARRLKNDWDATDEIISKINPMYLSEYKKLLNKVLRRFYAVKCKIMPRETSIAIDEEYLNKLYGLIDKG